MALFSFRHSVKTFSEKRSAESRIAKHGQTAAHLKYITRPKAARVVIRARLAHPTDALIAAAAEREAERRKGRVCERFILALPVEATPGQREALVRAFGDVLTKGVAGYIAAIHDQRGNDTNNPHAHIAAFDVHLKGGGRGRPRSTIGMARKNAVEETAALWADIHNRMMAAWGYGVESQISHLSFAARGIDRLPEIHEGAASRQMLAEDETPATNSDWHHIDGGHTRAEANAIIQEINSLKREAEHDQTEPTNRLGDHNQGDREKRPDRGEDDRTGGGGSFGSNRPPSPPWATVVAPRNNDERSSSEGGASLPVPPPFFATDASPTHIPPFATDRGIRCWGGIRRIYWELVMLRDTLRSHLLVKREAFGVMSSRSRTFAPRPHARRQQHERD